MTQPERIKRSIREEILGEFGFVLLWEVDRYWANLKVYKITGRDENNTALFGEFGKTSSVINEDSETYLDGYLKWDGCCELDQGCPHWCGAHNFGYHILLLKHIYERSAELMESSDFDEWQLDMNIKDEYKDWYE